MSTPVCSRAWEAEAVEDGRLTGAGRESFEAHAAHCTDCSKEVAWLRELRKMRSLEPVEPSPMQRRRLRAAILRRANNRIVQPSEFGAKGWLIGVSSALALVIALVAQRTIEKRVSSTGSTPIASAPANDAVFEVVPLEWADWKVVRKGASAEVALMEGTLSIHVRKLHDGQRFAVTLPDGELEVRGTRFEVTVHDHATARVRVTEGVVALRVAGFSERTLAAGESWMQPLQQTQAGPSPQTQGSNRAPAMVMPPHEDTHEAPGEIREPIASPARPHHLSRPSKANVRDEPRAHIGDGGAGMAFQQAMAAFDTGAYADAEQKLTRFERDFPGDTRTEDASFLRIVCASRQGDPSAVLARARSYLAAYPNGLRRAAVEELLRSSLPSAERRSSP